MNKILMLLAMAVFISNQAFSMKLEVAYLPESDNIEVSFDGPPLHGRLKLSISTCEPGGDALGTLDYSGLVNMGSESLQVFTEKFKVSEFPCRPTSITIDGIKVSIPATIYIKDQPWGSNIMECIRPQLIDFRDYVVVNQKDIMKDFMRGGTDNLNLEKLWPGIDNLDTLTFKEIDTNWRWLDLPLTSTLLERISDCSDHFPNEK